MPRKYGLRAITLSIKISTAPVSVVVIRTTHTLTCLVVTGDWMRTSRPHLEKVINAGIRTVVYDGDADYICNYQGVENMVDALRFTHGSEYASTPWTSWKVNGVTTGQFKNAGAFSYVRIYRFVPRLKTFPFNLTTLLTGPVTLFLLTPSESCHTGCTPSLCSTRRWLANRSPRRKCSG